MPELTEKERDEKIKDLNSWANIVWDEIREPEDDKIANCKVSFDEFMIDVVRQSAILIVDGLPKKFIREYTKVNDGQLIKKEQILEITLNQLQNSVHFMRTIIQDKYNEESQGYNIEDD